MNKTRYDITFGIQFNQTGGLLSDRASSKLAILAKAAHQFGGATWTEHDGSYVHDGGRLVIERSATLTIIVDFSLGHAGGDVMALAEWIHKMLNQESVLVQWTDNVNAIFVKEQRWHGST